MGVVIETIECQGPKAFRNMGEAAKGGSSDEKKKKVGRMVKEKAFSSKGEMKYWSGRDGGGRGADSLCG